MSNYQNQNLNGPIYINGSLATNPSIFIAQTPYLLEKYDFDKIINGKNSISEFKSIFIGTAIGLFLNMSAKFIGNKIDNSITFDKWELYAFSISLFLMVVLILIDRFIDSERKKIIKKIKSHFNIN